jgi:uncharacterized protein YcbK (DUF882 family)
MGDLTKNFSKWEFECRCKRCTMSDEVLENVKLLAEQLQILRYYVDSKVTINSAYRCLDHNRAIGSSDSSQHPKGTAVDIKIEGYTPDEVVRIVENMLVNPYLQSFYVGGVGRYHTFTHLDIRKHPARWDKRTKLTNK